MSYMDEIIKKSGPQHLREFLLHSEKPSIISEKSYKERIDEVEKPALEYIRKKFPEMDEFEEITDRLVDYITATQEVYLEIGLKCGARLVEQLLNS